MVPSFFLLVLNSRSLMLASLTATGILAPIFLARLHGVCLWKPLAVQTGMALSLFHSWPMEPDGNPKMAYVMHLSGWLTILFVVLASVQAASLLKRLYFSS